ncbi:putative elongator complex protein 1 [Contarinia nasturtii]|uniref:putative elongator complex protein 1 n=1 Tax=Contarinia nasturtii TaxID=265458 RepID=UPI0012D47C38|nr:putative elongator complex protein 1 [Contarinia nasturtii]
MKNLELLYSRTAQLDVNNVNYMNLNTENAGTTFIASNDELLSFDWSKKQINVITPLQNEIVGFEHLSLNNELCVATAAGEVIVYNLHQSSDESVTFCEGGLKAMSWSNDQEVVVFVTQANSLVVMNSAYDPIAEVNLLDENFGDEAFINVGWGKKETQFHGTEGKQAAHKKPAEIAVEDVRVLDQRISIVWRGDDEYFAISFVGKTERMFKVFDKEGKLKYTSEKLAGLDAVIDWRPTGNWIAIPHVLPNKYTIALFEKNGLRHREIVLPFKKEEEVVEKLLWSGDSDILAIYTEHATGSTIYLYTICNYHWYQKQTLHFNGKCKAIQWDNNYLEGKSLHVIEQSLQYSVYRWDHSIVRSTGFTDDDQALVAVIDRNNLLLTNFRGAVIPPPMCGSTLVHSSPINYAGFIRQSTDSNRFFIVDTTNTFSTFECTFERNPERNLNLLEGSKLIQSYKIAQGDHIPLFNQHWTWLNELHVIFCYTKDNATVLSLSELREGQVNIVSTQSIDGIIGNIVVCNKSSKIIYQLTCGKFESIEILESKLQEPQFLFDVSSFCERIDCSTIHGEIKVIALKTQQNLYVDGEKVASDVTSFLLTEQFLLFTTLDQLKFIRLDGKDVINERRIERGGRLVTSVPHDSRTVLQMPRGNLETIQPRVLSLVIIAELLDAHSYRKAFDLLRKQRINLNLLADHNPIKFLSHIPEFIADIDNIQWLNLFLSDLLNEDVTVTMYASNYRHLKNRTFATVYAYKVDVICEQFCNVFEQDSTVKYLLPMITAHVKRKNLEKALEILWAVRQIELNPVDGRKTTVTAQEALKYLLYLVNVNDLYDVALGMYDFDLVLFVAQKSQKDPKEYLPFLNELKQLEENYRKYRIDNHLKRYSKALEHIVKCGVEKLEECLELIEKHNLYTQALRLFKPSDECYNDIVIQYADFLRSKGAFYEATLMYERGGDSTADFKQAVLSAKHTLDWKKCLRLARKSSYSKEETENLCRSLLPALKENNRFADAAELVRFFNPNSIEYIQVLCDGKFYQKAILESSGLPESQDEFIRNHLFDFARKTIEKIHGDQLQFSKFVARLQTIRKEKAEKLLNGDVDDDDCDMFSDTTSMNSSRFTGGSRGTAKSFRSSRSKRKHERKLLSLKEGNPFEDIALIDVIYTMVLNIFAQQQHIHELLKSLVDCQLDGIGIEVQKIFNELLEDIKRSLDVIWLPEMMVSGEIKVEEYMDYVRVQKEQHYAMIKPHQRAKPILTLIDWQLEILK